MLIVIIPIQFGERHVRVSLMWLKCEVPKVSLNLAYCDLTSLAMDGVDNNTHITSTKPTARFS
jgi:hypothetical protein